MQGQCSVTEEVRPLLRFAREALYVIEERVQVLQKCFKYKLKRKISVWTPLVDQCLTLDSKFTN